MPIPTTAQVLGEGRTRFSVRLAPSLARPGPPPPQPRPDPFLPADPRLIVSDLGADHLVVLNKYPVLPHHLLLITRRFVSQTAPLEPEDLRAASAALVPAEALVFYNAGPQAGASQPHRHLQVVRTPLHPGLPPLPLEELLLDDPPVRLALARLDGTDPQQVQAAWPKLVAQVGRSPAAPGPYNLLLTRRWLALVPRTQEHHGAVSINGLGLAGSLLMATPEERDTLARAGIEAALRSVCEAP